MIEVSREFKEAVYAPIRKTAAKVMFELLDNAAQESALTLATSVARIDRIWQVKNKRREMTHKYATFERDYFKLDGSFRIPPIPSDGDSELGWWSNEISDENGYFVVPQLLTLLFPERQSSSGLTITFDKLTNEYPTEFEIEVHTTNGILIETVSDNTLSTFSWSNAMDEYERINIRVLRWVNPFRRARIVEVDLGVFIEYDSDRLIKMNLIEHMNVVGDTLPANEIKIVIDNSNKEFNILNPSGFYRFLKERQEMSLSLGVEIAPGVFEYVNTQGYYLVDWQSDEGALTTTLTARNVIELLEKEYIQQRRITNLYDLAEDVLTKGQVPNFFIHPSLQDFTTTGFTDKVTLRKALQCIGIASKSAVYQNREGILVVEPFVILDQNTSYVFFAGDDMYAGAATPTVYSGYDMKNITFDNVFKEPQINLEKLIQSLIVVVHSNGTKTEHTFHNEGVREGAVLKCDNPLINSVERAADVASWIIAESNLRALYQVNWRQNPALECGDIVFIEDSFGAQKQSRITKQEYEFSGFLSGKTESKGGV